MNIDEYIETLPDEPLLALSELAKKVEEIWNTLPQDEEDQEYEFFLGSFALAKVLLNNTSIFIDIPSVTGVPLQASKTIRSFFSNVSSAIQDSIIDLKMAQMESKYSAKFSNNFAYEFSEGDLDKIQSTINDLRDMISTSELFEETHRVRLLARLEKLQSEMHKKMADLDRFWGLIGDAGVAIGKFGKDAQPFVELIRKITDIVWRTQSRAEELPSDTPMDLLPSNED